MCMMTQDLRAYYFIRRAAATEAYHHRRNEVSFGRELLAAMAKPVNPETVLRDRRAAEEIIRAGAAIITVSVGRGRNQQDQRQISPKLARYLQGATGQAVARALLTAIETDDELRRAGEAQGIDWTEWADSLEAAGLEGKHV